MERLDVRRTGSKLTGSILLSLGILAAAVGVSIPAAAQDNIGVYVSYADSFRANATNFPTPWLGSPNTTFIGCQPVSACTYDAGAIRVVNNSPSAVTVQDIVVRLNACEYTGWLTAPVSLAPGADLIITQLTSGEGQGCTGPTPNFFDTSDIAPDGTNFTFHCSPADTMMATVDVTIDNTTTSYTDSGQVLNTGGIDGGTCTGNESIQWTKIGSQPCNGSLLTLTPPAQSHVVLSSATVTATFTNSCGQPLSDTAVDFSVLSGPNTGTTGAGVTDANGQATFTYSSAQIGTDTLQASITNVVGTITSNTVTVTWTATSTPGAGAFVIGDREIAGPNAYWWGAQWWKKNPLSTGLAPAAFKGYEDSNQLPWCGQTWTARPGNSSKPPKSIPAGSEMAVIVSSAISKHGPTISGDIVAIVLVRTNAGYQANPGHPGTGTVLRTLCQTQPAAATTTTHTRGFNSKQSASTTGPKAAIAPTPNATPTPQGSPIPPASKGKKADLGPGQRPNRHLPAF